MIPYKDQLLLDRIFIWFIQVIFNSFNGSFFLLLHRKGYTATKKINNVGKEIDKKTKIKKKTSQPKQNTTKLQALHLAIGTNGTEDRPREDRC